MIYFYHGTDIDKSRVKAQGLLDSLVKKKPDAGLFKMGVENFDTSKLQEYIGGQGLFSSKYVVLLDRVSEDKEIKTQFLEWIKEIAESENIFIILEGKMDKVSSGKIEKRTEKTVVHDLLEKVIKKTNDTFALADAIERRDKKSAWMLYRKAIDAGEAVEALHGMIFWKIKTLILNGGSRMWKEEDLYKMLDELITIYHEARRGNGEIETGVEGFILGMG